MKFGSGQAIARGSPDVGASAHADEPQVAVHRWRDLSGGDALARWEALAVNAAEPNPFFEPWYLLPSLAALDPAGIVEVLTVQLDGVWLGLVPMTHEPRYYRWPLPQRRNWVHANAFLGAPLVAEGHEELFWEALLDHVDRTAGPELFLHLTQVPLDGPVHRALAAVCAWQGRMVGVVDEEKRALLASHLPPEAYLEASLTGKKRKELRRQYARLSEQGDLTVTHENDSGGLSAWTGDFLALEQRGWKGSAGSALASAAETARVFTEALEGAAARGRLERLTLALDGRPIAMLATFLTPPGAFSYKTAFDERFARFSPGVLLQRENLALLGHRSIEWCDSCAAADHPMIDHLWRERRAIGRISVAIGGALRRAVFANLLKAELARKTRRHRTGAAA